MFDLNFSFGAARLSCTAQYPLPLIFLSFHLRYYLRLPYGLPGPPSRIYGLERSCISSAVWSTPARYYLAIKKVEGSEVWARRPHSRMLLGAKHRCRTQAVYTPEQDCAVEMIIVPSGSLEQISSLSHHELGRQQMLG